MLRVFVVIAAATAAVTAIPFDGSARMSPACADRDMIVSRLASEYSETANGRGQTREGGVLEIFSSPQGSWTILLTRPGVAGSLVTCLVAHGESWEKLPSPKRLRGKTS